MADVYDAWYGIEGTEETVARLIAMTPEAGAVLELGSGTGRLALPLAHAGLAVTVVEASQRMLDEMATQPGSEVVCVHCTDMSSFSLPDETFDLIVCAYHTFFQLPSDAAQLSCLECVARHLRPAGRVVLEGFVADQACASSSIEVWRVEADRVVLSVNRHDPTSGAVEGQAIDISEHGIRLRPWHVHYLTTHALDDLAHRAGLKLLDRWGGWDAAPFGDGARRHISFYGQEASVAAT